MNESLEEVLSGEWAEEEEMKAFYQKWAGKTPLLICFNILDKDYPDWNLEGELGSWSTEFLEDVLEEIEDSWEEMPAEELEAKLQERIGELYEDCVEIHQFSRINVVRQNLKEGEDENEELDKTGSKIGFPVIR